MSIAASVSALACSETSRGQRTFLLRERDSSCGGEALWHSRWQTMARAASVSRSSRKLRATVLSSGGDVICSACRPVAIHDAEPRLQCANTKGHASASVGRREISRRALDRASMSETVEQRAIAAPKRHANKQ
jgi:hypothetical protein